MRSPLALLAACVSLVVGLGLGGCTLYLGPDSDDAPGSPPRPEGWECRSDDDCAAGCYCDDQGGPGGVCIEAGFCSDRRDCPDGFVCDERSSCVPGDREEPPPPPRACEEIADETACLEREDCAPAYTGIGCTSPDGSSCTQEMANCTCESFVFAACVTVGR